jgi:DHA1 family bicyclomycin/chloramphenicol resistance-like MFS transporter
MRKRQAATLAVISALGPFQFDTYLPALPALMVFMNTTDAMVQLTVAASLVGMAMGQLFVGPISDAYGRHRPLLIAMAVFTVSALACLVATDITWMIIARFVLGFSAAGGFVINNAFIRDIATGQKAAKLYATQAAIFSLAPVVAPLAGGQLLLLGDWHVIFVFLIALGILVFTMSATLLPETLPLQNRTKLSFGSTFSSWKILLRDGRFVTLALISGFAFGSIAAFIGAAPFVFERGYGLTPTQYTFVFATITALLFAGNALNRFLLKRAASITMLRIGLIQAGVAAIGMVVLNILQVQEMWLVMLVISVSIASNSFTSSNINGLAMQEHGERAGVAAGLIGFTGSIFGAMAASLTGPLFGLTAMGMLSFMAILLLSGSTLGLVGLRNEAPLKH